MKYFALMTVLETRRNCRRCKEQAVAWIYLADKTGKKNTSSREPVCRKHLAAERPNL